MQIEETELLKSTNMNSRTKPLLFLLQSCL